MKTEILSQSAVMDAITKVMAGARALQGQIHQCALSTLSHVAQHGDFRGVAHLLNGLPNGQRVQALVVWYQHFSDGALQIKKANGSFSVSLKQDWQNKCTFDLEGADATDYAAFTKESKPAAFTVEKLVKWLESKANNMDDAEVAPETRGVAAKLVATYRDMIKIAVT
jgi:hypothetical protein